MDCKYPAARGQDKSRTSRCAHYPAAAKVRVDGTHSRFRILRLETRKWQPTPGFLPREFHGQRSLEGYSPWDRKESDTTESLHFIILLCICFVKSN